MNLNYGFATHEPELFRTLAYRDATNPVYVIEGNPSLRNIHINHAGMRGRTIIPSKQLQLSFYAGYHHSNRDHRQILTYDVYRSTYLSRLENVRGNQAISIMTNYDQGWGDVVRLNNSITFIHSKSYAYLTQLTTSKSLQLNCQRKASWTEQFRLSMDWKWLKTIIYGGFNAQHFNNTLAQLENTTLWQNRMGVDAKLHKGKFTVRTDFYVLIRRGYSMSGMNTYRLIWNASASWRCLKGKGKLELELDDILNQADNFTSTETANQQVMSWSDQMHHYICIGFTYHLDAKGQK